MNSVINDFVLLTTFLLVSCGPPSPTDESAESAGDSTLEADCESFCTPAVECSEEYAADWEFETQQECVDYCILFTNGAVKFHDDPTCDGTTRAMWTCVGKLDTCEDFELYENAAFNKSGYGGKPCADELIEFLDNCN